ncbi:hypothetical protein NECAME_14392, partial [Necator americanus]
GGVLVVISMLVTLLQILFFISAGVHRANDESFDERRSDQMLSPVTFQIAKTATSRAVNILSSAFSLKALDLVTLRELAKRVNVIPVIAKSDTTCKDELTRFKNKCFLGDN